MRMAVDLQTAGPAEGFVARGADVAVLGLREGCLRGGGDVVVVLPGVGGGGAVGGGVEGGLLGLVGLGLWWGWGRWWEVGGEWALVVEVLGWVVGIRRGVVGCV